MKRVLLIAAVLLALLGASEASAKTTILCDPCSYPYQRWIDEAKVPTPDVTLSVVEAPCPGDSEAFSCTDSEAIWIGTVDKSYETWTVRGLLLHELGHSFDYYVLPAWARERFSWLVDRHGKPWANLEERFANEYMCCGYPKRYLADGPICRLIRNAAKTPEAST